LSTGIKRLHDGGRTISETRSISLFTSIRYRRKQLMYWDTVVARAAPPAPKPNPNIST
jgi:hypothetical protein